MMANILKWTQIFKLNKFLIIFVADEKFLEYFDILCTNNNLNLKFRFKGSQIRESA